MKTIARICGILALLHVLFWMFTGMSMVGGVLSEVRAFAIFWIHAVALFSWFMSEIID